MDGSGILETESREIGESYFEDGCLLPWSGAPGLPGSLAEINSNAVYDAARRMSQCVRIINRRQFLGYKVIVDHGVQKSVLTFRRYSVYNDGIDLFAGICDRITSTAPTGGWTNEWLMGVQLKPYHPSDSSIWKISAFGDYWPIFNRCLFAEPDMCSDEYWSFHAAYGYTVPGVGNLLSEAPTGYNYGHQHSTIENHMNQQDCGGDPTCEAARLKFYKSCQMYQADPEIESAVEMNQGGVPVVVLQFKTRLQNTNGEVDGAPDSIDGDTSGWVAATIESEPYRTIENAIRLYLLMDQTGNNAEAIIGDNALTSTIQAQSDNPMGCIIPHFLFTKLIPMPYEDGNDDQDEDTDTPLWSDVMPMMDLYLRAMCEGYVDTATTIERANCTGTKQGTCTTDIHDLFDFNYASLNVQASGNSWVGIMPTIETDYIDEEDTRSDNPFGGAQFPTMPISSEGFNRVASAIDLLTIVRIDLPWKIQTNTCIYTSDNLEVPGVPGDPCGGYDCGSSGIANYSGSPPGATNISPGYPTGWEDLSGGYGIEASTSSGFWYGMGTACTGINWLMSTSRAVVDYRYTLIDPDSKYAIPSTWRDMIEDCAVVGGLWCVNSGWFRHKKIAASPPGPGPTPCDEGGTCFEIEESPNATTCAWSYGGTIDCGMRAPDSYFYIVFNKPSPGDICTGGSLAYTSMYPLSTASISINIPLE